MDCSLAEPTDVASFGLLVFSVPFSISVELQHMNLSLSQFLPVEMSSDLSSAVANVSKDTPLTNELDLRHLKDRIPRELQLML